MALDPTVGGAASDTYISLADALVYFGERLQTSDFVDETDSSKQENALRQATARLDLEDFEGSPVNPLTGTSEGTTQALKFPRYGVTNPDGWDYLSTVIPEPIKAATCELALIYIAKTKSPFKDSGLEGFEDVKLGPISVKPKHTRSPVALPRVVEELIGHMLSAGGGRNQFTIERA